MKSNNGLVEYDSSCKAGNVPNTCITDAGPQFKISLATHTHTHTHMYAYRHSCTHTQCDTSRHKHTVTLAHIQTHTHPNTHTHVCIHAQHTHTHMLESGSVLTSAKQANRFYSKTIRQVQNNQITCAGVHTHTHNTHTHQG